MLAMATDCEQQTDGHIRRVTEYVRFLITAIRNNPNGYMPTLEQENNIILVAKLHDIGKMAVPGYILRKPGKLTAAEFDVVRTHPLYGAMFLDRFMRAEGSAPFLAVARDIALYHHEKWDGTGYPFGYRGKKLPLSARIVAIADVYDALVSTRPYRSAMKRPLVLSSATAESISTRIWWACSSHMPMRFGSFHSLRMNPITLEGSIYDYDVYRPYFGDR